MFTIPTIKMNNQSNNRDPLLDELDERIREGNIVFTPDEEFLKRVSENNNKRKNMTDEDYSECVDKLVDSM